MNRRIATAALVFLGVGLIDTIAHADDWWNDEQEIQLYIAYAPQAEPDLEGFGDDGSGGGGGGGDPGGGGCSDQCAAGSKQCIDGDLYQDCGDYNGDGCAEWSSPYSCGTSFPGTTCSDGWCVGSSGGGDPPPDPPPDPGPDPGAGGGGGGCDWGVCCGSDDDCWNAGYSWCDGSGHCE